MACAPPATVTTLLTTLDCHLQASVVRVTTILYYSHGLVAEGIGEGPSARAPIAIHMETPNRRETRGDDLQTPRILAKAGDALARHKGSHHRLLPFEASQLVTKGSTYARVRPSNNDAPTIGGS